MRELLYWMEQVWAKLRYEISRNGLRHTTIGVLEKGLVLVLSRSAYTYRSIAPRYFQSRASSNLCEYVNPPDVFKIEMADPEDINFITGRQNPHVNRRLNFGRVLEGDWDRSCEPFDEQPFYTSASAHFQEGVPWEETKVFEEYRQNLREGTNDPTLYHDEESLLSYLRSFDDLYERILNEGYATNSQIDQFDGKSEPTPYLCTLDEVTVDVGRDGELLFCDGKHRLTIAKLLEVEQIPITFLVRHRQWMEYRDRISRTNDVPDHPDLRDLRSEN